jgi:RimJ/RimL family protein N-acetyltransferase
MSATEITTGRLILRPLGPADAAFIVQLLNDPDFLRHIGDRGVRTEDDAREYIESGPLHSYAQHGFGLLRVELRTTGAPAGMCGLIQRPFLPHPDLGYAFLPEFRSQGYAREAAAAVLEHARESLGIRTVLAVVNSDNARSIRLLELLGMAYQHPMTMPGEEAEVMLFRLGSEAHA